MAANNGPMDAFNFMVVIDAVPVASFSDCILPAASIETVEYREGGLGSTSNVHKLPGLVRFGDLILKRGIANGPVGTALWDWFSSFVQGKGSPKTLTVTLMDGQQQPLAQWVFTNTWPVKYEAPPLSGKTSALAIETLEVAVDGMTFTLMQQGA